MLTYNRETKSITKGQWLKGTEIKHNKCYYDGGGSFTYVTLNYSNINGKHNEKGVGYQCTSTAPFFTANKPIEWFNDCWSPLYNVWSNKNTLTDAEHELLTEYCQGQQFEQVRGGQTLPTRPHIVLRPINH